jgi:hypothetical protein
MERGEYPLVDPEIRVAQMGAFGRAFKRQRHAPEINRSHRGCSPMMTA